MAHSSGGSPHRSQCRSLPRLARPTSTSTGDSALPPLRAATIIRKRAQARRWVALALQLVGLAAVGGGAWRGSVWGVIGAVGGLALALGWTIRWRPGRLRRRGPPPLGLGEVLDLLRQAYGATAGWSVGAADSSIEVLGSPDMDDEQRRRGAALVQLASVDGRLHVVRDPEATFVAVGDFPYAAGLALEGEGHAEALTDAIAAALRRFVARPPLAEEQSSLPRARIAAARVSRLVARAQTLAGLPRAARRRGGPTT